MTTTGIERIASETKQTASNDIYVVNAPLHSTTCGCFGAGGNESAWSGWSTKATGQNLEENLRALHQKLRQMSYRPQPVRCRDTKEDGTIRLRISCIEDKIVQEMTRPWKPSTNRCLSRPPWLPFREELPRCPATTQSRGNDNRWTGRGPRSRLDTMPHLEILTLLQQQIKDRKFLHWARMLKAGFRLLEGCAGWTGKSARLDCLPGVGEYILGSSARPMVYDQTALIVRWSGMQTIVSPCLSSRTMHGDLCESCRNDWRNSDCASTKPKPNCCRAFGQAAGIQGRERLPTFDFLGFTHYWGRSRTGKARLKRKTTKKDFVVLWRPSISGCARNATLVSYLRSGKPSGKVAWTFQLLFTDNSRALYRFERAVHALPWNG